MIFKEEQRFRCWDLIGALLLLGAAALFRLTQVIWNGYALSSSQVLAGLLVLFVISLCLLYFFKARMATKIDERGIRFKFFPWHFRKRQIGWDEIDSYQWEDLPFSAALSGWGVNYGTFEQVFSLSGRHGIHLKLKNGEELFIGTAHLQEMREVIDYFLHNQKNNGERN